MRLNVLCKLAIYRFGKPGKLMENKIKPGLTGEVRMTVSEKETQLFTKVVLCQFSQHRP